MSTKSPHRYKVMMKTFWRYRLWNPEKLPDGEATVLVSEEDPAPCTFYPLDGGPTEDLPRDKNGRPAGTTAQVIERFKKRFEKQLANPYADDVSDQTSYAEMQMKSGAIPLGADAAKEAAVEDILADAKLTPKAKVARRKSRSSSSSSASDEG